MSVVAASAQVIGWPSIGVRRRPHGKVASMRRARAADELGSAMVRMASGDEQAFVMFYEATSQAVFGIIVRVLRDRAQAEEVAQEVFLECWRTAARYDAAQGTPAAWINTIAHRRAVDRVRSVERAAQRDSRQVEDERDRRSPDVSDLVVARDEGTRVRAALDELSEAHRTALSLAYFEGRTQREVAEILNVPLGTVKTRMRDAMRKLRVRLDEGGPA